MLEAKAKDIGASVLQNFFSGDLKKEKSIEKNFSGNLQKKKTKKGLSKFFAKFLAFSNKILTIQKIEFSSRREQGNFWGLEASRPRPRTSKCVLEQ